MKTLRRLFAVGSLSLALVVALPGVASAATVSIVNLAKFPTLKQGSPSGPAVISMNVYLTFAGESSPGNLSKFDATATTKVRDFQKKHSLPQTGIVNQTTWKAILLVADNSKDVAAGSQAPKISVSKTPDNHYLITGFCTKVGQRFNFWKTGDSFGATISGPSLKCKTATSKVVENTKNYKGDSFTKPFAKGDVIDVSTGSTRGHGTYVYLI